MAINSMTYNKAVLYAPEEYWCLTQVQREEMTNGCGTRGLIGLLVPDTIYGLDVSEACRIHDFQYAVGSTPEEKDSADRAFINNLLRIIDANTKWKWLRKLRAERARTYYHAVCNFGGPAFWDGKNRPEEMGSV